MLWHLRHTLELHSHLVLQVVLNHLDRLRVEVRLDPNRYFLFIENRENNEYGVYYINEYHEYNLSCKNIN